MKTIRCLMCGELWKEKDNKDLKGLICPKCKRTEIGIVPKVNKLKQFYDKTSSDIGKLLAIIYYSFTKFLSSFLFYYGQDLLHFVTLIIILSIVAFMKSVVFINEPVYVIAAIVLSSLLITKIRF